METSWCSIGNGAHRAACQASIWCFFSIAQIAVMLFVIRSVLLSKSKAKDAVAAPYLDLRFVWPMGVVDPSEDKAAKKKN